MSRGKYSLQQLKMMLIIRMSKMIIEMIMMMEMIIEMCINFLNSNGRFLFFIFIFVFLCFIFTYESYPMISAPMNDDRSCFFFFKYGSEYSNPRHWPALMATAPSLKFKKGRLPRNISETESILLPISYGHK